MTAHNLEGNLTGIAMNLQSKIEFSYKEVLKSSIKALSEKLVRLESDLAITINFNNMLSLRQVELTGSAGPIAITLEGWRLKQMVCPKSLSNNAVEGKVCDIFGKLSFSTAKDNLDTCHWLKSKERMIVKIVGKDIEQIFRVKNGLRKFRRAEVDVPTIC